MVLFICHTPLQAHIASRIIELNNIVDYEVFYFTHTENQVQLRFFDKLSECSVRSRFYVCNKRFPFYWLDIVSYFKGCSYDAVYLASIDNIYVHLILEVTSFKDLFTYDDGNANIDLNSLYYVSERSAFKSFFYRALGVGYSIDKIKDISKLHYTIYPGFENIISNVKPLSIFDYSSINRDNVDVGSECNVFLGTYFDYVVNNDIDGFLYKLKNLFNAKKFVFYIPHPMERKVQFNDFIHLPSGYIAEEHIISLGSKFEKINVYGVASSVLFNLIGVSWVNCISIVSNHLTNDCNNVSNFFAQHGGQVLDVDI